MYLDTGRSPDSFWNLSVSEVIDCLESHGRMNRKKAQEQEDIVTVLAAMLYNQAEQTATMIGSIFTNEVKVLPLSDYYPTLFDRPEIQERKQNAELSQYIADMKVFAERHNQRFATQEQEGGETYGSGYDAGEAEGSD